jgi:UDP-N-acetylglucosamine 3-dehydrogenase
VGSIDHLEGQLKAAVIGLGAMGRHHVRVYGELPDVSLMAVADVSEAAVDRATDQRLIQGYTDIEAMLDREQPDLVSIVVPTSLHRDVTMMAIERGIHVLVEKPIAGTLAEAREMIAAAERANVRLMVGHIERFNPAIVELKRRIEQVGNIFQISARRVGPFPDRIRDVGVVVDLASHDIDAMNYILESPVESVYAQTAQRIHTAHEDMILGTLRFTNGTIGALDVNWLTPTKIRELTVVGSRGTFVANYLTQDLAFFENAATLAEWADLTNLQQISEGHAIRYAFRKEEPLRAELSAFVDCIRNDTPAPAPPEGAADALAIALDLIESSRIGQPVHPTPVRA